MVSGNVFSILENVTEVVRPSHRLQGWTSPEIICRAMEIIAKY